LGLEARIGLTSATYREAIAPALAAGFARAIGAPDDLAQAGVPPTFVTRCRRGEFELMNRLDLPLERVLHGEQEYAFAGELRVGETLVYRTRYASHAEKRGMQFLVFETEIFVGAGEAGDDAIGGGAAGADTTGAPARVTARTTLVVRETGAST
jgi:hypothetical protein